MARRLIIMRHAKSDWANANLTDHDRPLNARGRRTAPLMAEHLLTHCVLPEVIVASTAVRVQETLELLLGCWTVKPATVKPEVVHESSLYLASYSTLIETMKSFKADWTRVMMIGHNPGLSDLVGMMSGTRTELSTAAVAVFETTADSWMEAVESRTWTLTNLWRPRELFG